MCLRVETCLNNSLAHPAPSLPVLLASPSHHPLPTPPAPLLHAAAVSQGVLAVVELLIRRHSDEYMVVANAISCLTHLMEALQVGAGWVGVFW